MQDLRFALRQLLKNPGFTAVAVLSLTLGIAANTTIFSFVNALLLRPPPVEEPDTLWQVWKFRPNASSELKRHNTWSRVALAYLRDHTQSCAAIAGADIEPRLTSWSHDGLGESVQSLMVSGNFFEVCGIRPALGRFFIPEEDRTPGTHPVVVVSHDFWRNRLNADPQALGRTVTINGVALTVIGVAPERFTGVMAGVAPDLWVPFMMVPSVLHDGGWLTTTDSHSVIGWGRLKPGVTAAQASAELSVLTRQYEEELPGNFVREDGAVLTPSLLVPVLLRGYVQSFTGVLMGAVFLVLLIACANAANLQLARAVTRRQEMAVRGALGATRGRLIRQLLAESVLLATLGGGLGLLLSAGLVRWIGQFVPTNLPIRLSVEFDWRVLAFTASVSVLTGMLFGLAPAFRGTRLNLAATLKDETRGLAVRRSRLANALIVGQMALCLVLLLAATLCLRSLRNARAFDPGFVVRDRVVAGFNLNDFGYTAAQAKAFQARLLERVQALPGVRSAALTGYLPLGTEHSNGNMVVEGQELPRGEQGFFFEMLSVGPGYFATMGTALLQGREFTGPDREGTPRVAIINEAAANRYWPGQNPIGRRLGDPQNALEIVGVVPTGRYRSLGEDPRPAFYTCFLQEQRLSGVLVAQVQGATRPVLSAIRGVFQDLDPRLAPTRLSTLDQHLTLALFPMRTSGLLLGVLGLVALILAVSGLFGVIAYSVSQRTREVGIRMALGAQRGEVLRLVMRQGLKLAGIGTVVGIIGALAATRLLRGLLFGVGAMDPLTFIAVPLLLLAVALLACWVPARRAARVDPVEALRTE
ncbi:MAG: ABC transporter permease [Verrucomicrobiae bacterium]|nr:ABC transporter permease [Verrucomicrobiae bacterium]